MSRSSSLSWLSWHAFASGTIEQSRPEIASSKNRNLVPVPVGVCSHGWQQHRVFKLSLRVASCRLKEIKNLTSLWLPPCCFPIYWNVAPAPTPSPCHPSPVPSRAPRWNHYRHILSLRLIHVSSKSVKTRKTTEQHSLWGDALFAASWAP